MNVNVVVEVDGEVGGFFGDGGAFDFGHLPSSSTLPPLLR